MIKDMLAALAGYRLTFVGWFFLLGLGAITVNNLTLEQINQSAPYQTVRLSCTQYRTLSLGNVCEHYELVSGTTTVTRYRGWLWETERTHTTVASPQVGQP